jgi:predicted site-specific integrase-resolvase
LKQTPITLSCWPRLLSLKLAAAYASVCARTVEDWIHDGLLAPVPMPGSTLKDKQGNIIALGSRRRISKILIAREDLDRLIDQKKAP